MYEIAASQKMPSVSGR